MHNSGQSPGGEALIIDCTDQPIQRPSWKQQSWYSGKKKRHTIKTEIVITENGRIVSIYNHALSSFRVRFEHSIGRLKFFRVLSERYRYPRNRYACKISIVAGIKNFAAGLLVSTVKYGCVLAVIWLFLQQVYWNP